MLLWSEVVSISSSDDDSSTNVIDVISN